MLVTDDEGELHTVEGAGSLCPLCENGNLEEAGEDYLCCPDGCGMYFSIYED